MTDVVKAEWLVYNREWMQRGDRVRIVDGQGGIYSKAQLDCGHPQNCSVYLKGTRINEHGVTVPNECWVSTDTLMEFVDNDSEAIITQKIEEYEAQILALRIKLAQIKEVQK
jgi:hypothetical protein